MSPEKVCPYESLHLFDPNETHAKAVVDFLLEATTMYSQVHKYICVVICPLGIAANVLHILVLTRPLMWRCAVNRLLVMMAFCDITVISSYLIFNIRFGILVDDNHPDFGYPWPWICFLLVYVVCTYGLHAVSLYLSAATAYIRFHAVNSLASKWLLSKSATPIFVSALVLVSLASIPSLFVHKVYAVSTGLSGNHSLYIIKIHTIALKNRCFLFKANLWLTAIVFRVIPCILLMFFTAAFIRRLYSRRRKQRSFRSPDRYAALKRLVIFQNRTTKTLLTLLTVFLVAELPQGVIAIMNGLFPNEVHVYFYLSFGELLDLLTILEGFACCTVYAAISPQYRTTFLLTFGCKKYSAVVNGSLAARIGASSSIFNKKDEDKAYVTLPTTELDRRDCHPRSSS